MRSMIVFMAAIPALLVQSLAAAARATEHPSMRGPASSWAQALEGGVYTKLADDLDNALRALGYVADIETDIGAGFDVYGGYRAHPNLALEAEFEMIPSTDITSFGLTVADLETWTVTGNLKAFALTGSIQPFGVVGLGVLHSKLRDSLGAGISESVSGFAVRVGAGVDVYSTENIVFSIRAAYVVYTGGVSGLDYVPFGAGIQYRF